MILVAEPASDPPLAVATLVHGVVADLIHQNQFPEAIIPEVVELAVVGTGLGMLRSNIVLFGKSASFWDSTLWGVAPRPFLDTQSLAYANAIAAWAREDKAPAWARGVIGEVRRPMNQSLKFLFKTNDSFFQPTKRQELLRQDQRAWWALAASDSPTQQVVAIRHLQSDQDLSDSQASLLLEKLTSSNRAIVLHTITAVERMAVNHTPIATDSIVGELRSLTEHRDDEIHAKAMCALTRLAKLDDRTIEAASMMLEDSLRHVVFAGAFALSSLDSIPDDTLQMVDRSFVRSLQACDYEFVGLFARSYQRWLDDPKSHFEELLSDDPEYLPIALDALQQEPEQIVSIG